MRKRRRGKKKNGNRKREGEREVVSERRGRGSGQLRKPSYRILLLTIISNLGQFYSPHIGDITYPMQGVNRSHQSRLSNPAT